MSDRIKQLIAFIEESPNDPFLHYALTMEYQKLGDDEKTILGFERLINEYPDYVGTYYHFGKLLEKKGETNRALDIYQKGMQVAQAARNRHALGELQGAYNQASGFDEDDDFDD